MTQVYDVKSKIELRHPQNDIMVRAYEDGELSFSSDGAENFVYLYPHQVKLLKAFLADLEEI